MSKKALFLVVFAVSIATDTHAASHLDETFVSLYNAMNPTNITLVAFTNEVTSNRFALLDYCKEWRPSTPDPFMETWFTNLVSAVVPDDVDAIGTNYWLKAKQYAIADIAHDNAVCNSTSCWFAAADEHGKIRASMRADCDWDALLGIEQCPRETMPDGVVVISVPDLFGSEQLMRDEMVRKMKREQKWYECVAMYIHNAFDDFVRSSTFKNLPLPERNAIVSNLVETARFTAEEAASLGLTNVTTQVEE